MLRWKGKMKASERRVLINYLVAEVAEKAAQNDEMMENVLLGQALFCIA